MRWPYRGTVAWLSADRGGRETGPPTPGPDRDGYATTAFVPPDTDHTGLASFVLRGFDPHVLVSQAEGRWLVPGFGGVPHVLPGDVVVITEGARTVASFHVEAVELD